MPLVSIKKGSMPRNVNYAAKIFSKYGDFIRGVIRYQVDNDAQADDLYQDLFLSLVSKPLPADIQNIKSYLYRAITNDAVDARRIEKYQALMHKYAEYSNYSINKSGPENALIEKEEMNKMFRLIEGWLPRSEAQAIILRYKHNYNTKEVAKKMKVNNRSVSRYISTGLYKVRQFLAARTGGSG
ncbi:MAG: RNA polymerase sigma factor [Planctomycetota bacterium]|jgi:RNA polymerase sigma factor (sigma-70 family)